MVIILTCAVEEISATESGELLSTILIHNHKWQGVLLPDSSGVDIVELDA